VFYELGTRVLAGGFGLSAAASIYCRPTTLMSTADVGPCGYTRLREVLLAGRVRR
jgi:hypothetical protein